MRQQVAQREGVAHVGVEVEQALLERDHAGRSHERLRQGRESEQRARPDGVVTAALAHAGIALRKHAAGVHDDCRDARHEAIRNPAVDRCERFLHTSHGSGCARFRNIHGSATFGTLDPVDTVADPKPIQMVRGATMAATSVNDRNDADLAIGYRAALRRAAAAAREAAVLEDLLMARGASAIAGDETLEVETMIVGVGRRSLELHETSLSSTAQ